jgi:hypothetical protein
MPSIHQPGGASVVADGAAVCANDKPDVATTATTSPAACCRASLFIAAMIPDLIRSLQFS